MRITFRGDSFIYMMESLKKYLPAFDLMLFGGLGCGALALCILGSVFVYIWQNPPRASAIVTPVSGLPTMSPGGTAPVLDFSNRQSFLTHSNLVGKARHADATMPLTRGDRRRKMSSLFINR